MNKDIRFRQSGFDYRYRTWHTINRNMILYIHSGNGSIVSREQNYPMVHGCLCFVGSNKFYYTLPDIPKEYIRSKIFLSNQALEQVLSLFPTKLDMKAKFNPNTLVYAQLSGSNIEHVENLFENLATQANQEFYRNALIFSSFTELLVKLHKHATDSVPPISGAIPLAVEYINSHIHQNIDIDDICAEIHISKYHFCRKFKETTGSTVMSYILKTRITTAMNLLENPNLSMSEVSETCGFSSLSYFCRVFKEEVGTTPLQYQKRLKM